MPYIPFVDVSYAQGNYNMGSNSDPIIAIRMSSGDGGLHFDSQATANYNAASAAGKTIINYHFAGTADPTMEAKFFIEAVSPFAENDVYALDIEQGQDAGWINTFCEYVHSVTGAWPLVYMNISTANSVYPSVQNCGLWLAAPSWGFDQTITELNPSIVYVAQQGPIVNGVDSDAWFGTIEELQAYGYHTSPTPAPQPSVPVPVPAPEPVPSPAAPAPPEQPATPVVITPTAGQGSGTSTPVTIPVKVSPPLQTAPKLSFWQTIIKFIKEFFA
jgi:glycosyl hydrolase family 25